MPALRTSPLRTPPRGGVISMPRDLSQTPAISRLGSTVKTPHIQKCFVDQMEDDEHPLEHMTVFFEEEDLRLVTTGLLGKGGFGKVFEAVSNSGESYALKVSSKRMNENDWKRLKEEVTLMSHFSRHPNIVRFYAAGKDEDRAYVVMERCAGKSLHDIIASRSLEIPEVLWIGWALVSTISYIHSKGCIHRDLKPQNLLFDNKGNLKITDFGLSSRISEAHPRKTVAGTAMYMAPEMASEVYKRMTKTSEAPSLSYGKEVDTWSIGVVLYVLLTRMNPYLDAMENKGMRQMDKEHKTVALFNAVAKAAWTWPRDWNGDSQLRRLVDRVLHREPSRRATLMEILEDTVWNRRPLSCPLSLLQKLDLLEPSLSNGAPLNNLGENLQSRPKRTAESVLREGLERIVATEQRARAQLELEHHETYEIVWSMISLFRAEGDNRADILQSEEMQRGKLHNQFQMRQFMRRRSGSLALVSDSEGHKVAAPRSSLSVRRSISLSEDEQGKIVRSSPDQYAVVYPGRDTATRWNLRPVVSLPRDMTDEIERDFKCMNGHVMTKLTSMPHGYSGFDCNVCDRGILKITGDSPAFRCYKCDYDVCAKCAYLGKFKDVNFVCVTCAKKFTSATKLQGHSLRCRGPSESPSPRRSSRMSTMVWEEPKRPSLLEVQLPDAHDPVPRSSGRRSARPTYNRTSTGERISIGDSNIRSIADFDAVVNDHREADFPEESMRASATRRTPSKPRRPRGSSQRVRASSSSNDSLSLTLPPQVEVPSKDAHQLLQPRSSAELRDVMEEVGRRKNTSESDRILSAPGSPPQYNSKGDIIGIAARRRAESVEMIRAEVITIRADVADRPREMSRQPRVPRSASSSRAENNHRSPQKRGRVADQAPEAPLPNPAKRAVVEDNLGKHTMLPPQAPRGPHQLPRAPSVSGHTPQGGPPLPRRGPAAASPAPSSSIRTAAFQTSAAIPPQGFASMRQSRYSMTNAMAVPHNTSSLAAANGLGSVAAPTRSHALSRPSGAFLALPREEHNRQQFLDDFLSGGWVRFYSFTNEDTVVMYYSLQPGRYGAMFPTEAGVGTAVLDVYSKLVLYVPCMNNESTNRNQPHPHVQTFYDEEARILSLTEAQRYLGGVLRCITGFVDEFNRLRSEGLTPAAVHAAYVYHRNMSHVPRDTKFVYIRKVFPDPSGSFTLFRLSNLRSQVICNAMVDIRWQSDRRHNVGQKYYVNADGTAEPFVIDQTGILSQVETVLNNNFRR